MKKKRMILIEFNELCPDLLQDWMKEGLLPNFRSFHETSQVFVTEADVTNREYLEPWIQWYSIHTGLNFDVHGVSHLTDGSRAGHEDIWRRLMDQGKIVANFSSMNCRGFDKNGSVFLPDPWGVSEQAHPRTIKAFHQFVSTMVQEYSNKDKTYSLKVYFDFLRFCVGHGLTLGTITKILKQIFQEKFIDSESSWKRPTILDRLQFDVFKFYEKKYQFDFSTFFSNSTAHFQHAYWRYMEPDAFRVKPSSADIGKYKNAVLFGYQEMDNLLGKFFQIEDNDVLLVLATALSQQAYLKNEEQGGQLFYRPRNIEILFEMLGLCYDNILPVMTHQFLVRFKDQESTENARKKLEGLKYGKREIFGFSQSEKYSLFFGVQIFSEIPLNTMIDFKLTNIQSFKFFDLFYKISDVKSGCHHPDGVLWFKTGHHKTYSEKVSILDILPTTLAYLNVPLGEINKMNFPGRNLSSEFEDEVKS